MRQSLWAFELNVAIRRREVDCPPRLPYCILTMLSYPKRSTLDVHATIDRGNCRYSHQYNRNSSGAGRFSRDASADILLAVRKQLHV